FHVMAKPYRTGSLGVAFESFAPAYEEAREADIADGPAARIFFERHFLPVAISPGEAAKGFVTGFYEPVVGASPTRTGRFVEPLLARPHDLIDIGDENRPQGMDPYLAFARQTEAGPVEY